MQVNPNAGRKRLTKVKGYRYETRLKGGSFFTKKPYFISEGETRYYRQEKVHPVSNQYIWIEVPKGEFEKMDKANRKLRIPDFLNRSIWSEEDHERSRIVWDKIIRKLVAERAEARARTDAEIFRKTRNFRRMKELKQVLRKHRKAEKDERRARRVRKVRMQGEHDDQILGFLKSGSDTTGKLAKKTGLETRLIRRSLKRLLAAGKATKVSARVYAPVKAKPPQQASEGAVGPKQKRSRLGNVPTREKRRKRRAK